VKENDVKPCASVPDESAERTRVSLLEKVRNPENKIAWDEFYRRYSTLIRSYAASYSFATKMSLTHDDIEDVVLIVMAELSRELAEFDYRPGKRSFRSFLATVTRRRSIDFFRKKICRPDWNPPQLQEAVSDDGAPRTSPIDRLPDERTGELERLIRDHDRTVGRDLALEILRGDRNVTRHKYSIFEKVVMGVPVADICAQFDVLPGVVYTTKSLVMPYYEKALHKAKAELDEPTELPPAF